MAADVESPQEATAEATPAADAPATPSALPAITPVGDWARSLEMAGKQLAELLPIKEEGDWA